MRIIRLSRVRYSPQLERALANPSLKTFGLYNTLMFIKDLGREGPNNMTDVAQLIGPGGVLEGRYAHLVPSPLYGNVAYLNYLLSSVTPSISFLAPLMPIIDMIIKSSPPPPVVRPFGLIDTDAVNELNYISANYGGASYGTKAQHYPMFRDLYARFKKEVSDAANAIGNTKLASAIGNNALLNPSALYNATLVAKGHPTMYSVTEDLLNKIMGKRYDTKFTNQNFEIIKEQLMQPFSVVTVEQKKQIEERRKEEEYARIDPSSLDPNNPSVSHLSLEETVPFSVGEKEWTDPHFLTSIMIFFMEYYKRISSLPT